MGWRRLLRVLHRDIGYLVFGLVVAYAVSGLAVNHVDDWNPSYSIEVADVDIGAVPDGPLDALEAHVAAALRIEAGEITGRRRPGPNAFIVFLRDGGEARVALDTGRGTLKRVTPRHGLFEMNVLHLNHLKGAWTIVADVFSVLLLFLAFSGILFLKGRTGFTGRGKWFVLAGLVVPVAFLVHYHLTR